MMELAKGLTQRQLLISIIVVCLLTFVGILVFSTVNRKLKIEKQIYWTSRLNNAIELYLKDGFELKEGNTVESIISILKQKNYLDPKEEPESSILTLSSTNWFWEEYTPTEEALLNNHKITVPWGKDVTIPLFTRSKEKVQWTKLLGSPNWVCKDNQLTGKCTETDTIVIKSAIGVVTLTILAKVDKPIINIASHISSVAGARLKYTFLYEGNVDSWSVEGLPNGIELDENTIVGTTFVPGDYNIVVTAKNSAGTTSTKAILQVIPAPPKFNLPNKLKFTLDSNVNYKIPMSIPATEYSAEGLPLGLKIVDDSIVGSPKQLGTYAITLTCINSKGLDRKNIEIFIENIKNSSDSLHGIGNKDLLQVFDNVVTTLTAGDIIGQDYLNPANMVTHLTVDTISTNGGQMVLEQSCDNKLWVPITRWLVQKGNIIYKTDATMASRYWRIRALEGTTTLKSIGFALLPDSNELPKTTTSRDITYSKQLSLPFILRLQASNDVSEYSADLPEGFSLNKRTGVIRGEKQYMRNDFTIYYKVNNTYGTVFDYVQIKIK